MLKIFSLTSWVFLLRRRHVLAWRGEAAARGQRVAAAAMPQRRAAACAGSSSVRHQQRRSVPRQRAVSMRGSRAWQAGGCGTRDGAGRWRCPVRKRVGGGRMLELRRSNG